MEPRLCIAALISVTVDGFWWEQPWKERLEERSALQRNYHLCIAFWELRGLSPNFHFLVCERYIISQDWSTYFPAAEWADISWKYINLSQIYECRNWETEHHNSVLEITVSFMGIHRLEPNIYIGFSLALHFQWGSLFLLLLTHPKYVLSKGDKQVYIKILHSPFDEYLWTAKV